MTGKHRAPETRSSRLKCNLARIARLHGVQEVCWGAVAIVLMEWLKPIALDVTGLSHSAAMAGFFLFMPHLRGMHRKIPIHHVHTVGHVFPYWVCFVSIALGAVGGWISS